MRSRRSVGTPEPRPEITLLQNLRSEAQNRVAPVPIARSSFSSSQANAEQVARAESNRRVRLGIGIKCRGIGCADELDGRHSVHNEK
jgi:hypothetical protein